MSLNRQVIQFIYVHVYQTGSLPENIEVSSFYFTSHQQLFAAMYKYVGREVVITEYCTFKRVPKLPREK